MSTTKKRLEFGDPEAIKLLRWDSALSDAQAVNIREEECECDCGDVHTGKYFESCPWCGDEYEDCLQDVQVVHTQPDVWLHKPCGHKVAYEQDFRFLKKLSSKFKLK